MTLSGIVRATKGEIRFKDRAVQDFAPDAIVKLGVSQVPEGRCVFQHLTVKENLDLGAFTRSDEREIEKDREELLTLFPILKNRLKTLAGNLSGGEQQMLAMARALMARPRLLLLDEPSLGLAPKMVDTVFSLIHRINQSGITILLVEQNVNHALAISNRGYVLETGRIVISGSGKELLEDEHIKTAYLGF